MRITAFTMSAGIVIMLALVSYAPAQTTSVKKKETGAAATGGAVRTPAATVKKPKAAATGGVGTKATTVMPLTEGECTQLGGEVQTESAGVCNSGKFCGRRDENGNAHRVCSTAAK
jgi:hypothetical protein